MSAGETRKSRRATFREIPRDISPAEVRRELKRVILSGGFAQSERMSRFLTFVVEEALAGRASEIKEFAVGQEVFDKSSDYDPRTDPIVRVEARRLREKLRLYYEGEGARAEVRIKLPKGRYAPRFEKTPPAKAPPAETTENRIAVLPFANLSAGTENEYFSDGLTEELIHVLTKVEDLQVVAWGSALQFKGPGRDIYEIGRRLQVRHVLEGSVRRYGERLRVTVQLVNASDGRYLWSETYDRRMVDLFAVQDEITEAIVRVLKVKLAGGRRPPEKACDINAFQLYLRGRYFWNKRTLDGMTRSVDCYRQALASDAQCALAFAGLADSFSVMALYGLHEPRHYMEQAREAAGRAIELDSTLAEPHNSLGFILSHYDWDWETAEIHYRKSIELNPGYATARLWYGIDFLAMRGRFDEAFQELEESWKLDPLSLIGREAKGYMLMLARRYEEAIAAYRELAEEEPSFYKARTSMGRTYSLMNQYDLAISHLKKGREMGGDVPNILGALGQTYAQSGNHDAARGILGELGELAKEKYVTCSCFALVHMGLNENEKALDWLEKGCARRELTCAALKVHPAYDNLQSEPRFQAILTAVGLA